MPARKLSVAEVRATFSARRGHSIVLLLSLAAAACGPGEPASVAAHVTTVDGEERWLYPASPANRLAWSFDTLAVIGDAFTEDDAYQFDGVVRAGLAGDDDGRLYILDRSGKRVLRFGSGGEHLGTYGRAGRGPGELEQPLALSLGPGDSIWVSDIGNQRITIYPAAGGDARGIDYGGGGMAPMEIRTRGDGYVHLVQQLRTPGSAVDGDPPTPLVRFRADGSVRDTIWELPPPRRDVTQTRSGGNVAVIAVPTAFAPARRWELLRDGTVALSHTAEYSIALIRPDGTLLRRIERDPPPRPTTDADREAERERRAERMGRGGMVVRMGGGAGGGPAGGAAVEGALARSLEAMQFEPVIPRVAALAVDGSDRIWVGVSVDTPGEVERIDIYSPEGNLLGELHGMPFPDLFFGQGLAARLERDELDVQRVLVLRLDEGGGE